nr:MAG TPA: hypothetical protein [Caudoviricetes sp.]
MAGCSLHARRASKAWIEAIRACFRRVYVWET